MKRPVKFRMTTVLVAVGIAIGIGLGGCVAWTRIARYPAYPDAGANALETKTKEGWFEFRVPRSSPDSIPTMSAPGTSPVSGTSPDSGASPVSGSRSGTGFIFYPGGLVDPAAYAPFAMALAERGIMTVIVPMPLDLAVLGSGKARAVIAARPEIRRWIIGGHSLGGAMAAEFAKKNPGKLSGIVFLASYPAKSTNLSALPLKGLSIYGTRDGVAATDFEATLARLPAGSRLLQIEGGNHAGFGAYGPQKGDGEATIPRDEQIRISADAVAALADSLAD